MSSEKIDLVNSNGDVKKQSVSRSEIQNYPELYMQIVIGVIVNEHGEILVHKRKLDKKFYPGEIDHVCGGIMSGETPEEAFIRESLEETGIKPVEIKLVEKNLNKYGRFKYLFVAKPADGSKIISPNKDAEWVAFMHLNILKEKFTTGEIKFVEEFFEETDKAIKMNK